MIDMPQNQTKPNSLFKFNRYEYDLNIRSDVTASHID